MSDCNGAIDGARRSSTARCPAVSTTLYAEIRTRAPAARVVVVGYPRIFNGEDCNAATFFSPTEEARLNQTADLLNSRLATVAAGAGFGFANPTDPFVGHAVCDDPSGSTVCPGPSSRAITPTSTARPRATPRR